MGNEITNILPETQQTQSVNTYDQNYTPSIRRNTSVSAPLGAISSLPSPPKGGIFALVETYITAPLTNFFETLLLKNAKGYRAGAFQKAGAEEKAKLMLKIGTSKGELTKDFEKARALFKETSIPFQAEILSQFFAMTPPPTFFVHQLLSPMIYREGKLPELFHIAGKLTSPERFQLLQNLSSFDKNAVGIVLAYSTNPEVLNLYSGMDKEKLERFLEQIRNFIGSEKVKELRGGDTPVHLENFVTQSGGFEKMKALILAKIDEPLVDNNTELSNEKLSWEDIERIFQEQDDLANEIKDYKD